jgi:hypothetical protein
VTTFKLAESSRSERLACLPDQLLLCPPPKFPCEAQTVSRDERRDLSGAAKF